MIHLTGLNSKPYWYKEKKMKIILLSGKPYTGKSTTFNLLYDKITQNGTKNIVSDKKELGNPKNKDFECVVKYNKEKEVAIYSMGDYYGECINAIIKYANRDVLVLAYSKKFAKELDKLIGSFSHHCVIRKSSSNEKDCESIISELRSKQ
jgi:tRNA uridine 5-carbamoylmethylation protein Kti12